MKLHIYTDYGLLAEHVPAMSLLAPFYLHHAPLSPTLKPWFRVHSRYKEISPTLFEITSLEAATLAILPFNWSQIAKGCAWWHGTDQTLLDRAIQFVETATRAGKPTVIFFSGDRSFEEIPLKNTLVFRHSLNKSIRKPGEFCLPAFVEDFVAQYLGDEFWVREKSSKPTVSFDGRAYRDSWIENPQVKLKDFCYTIPSSINRKPLSASYTGHFIRSKALDYLSNSHDLKLDQTVRDNMVFIREKSADKRWQIRAEFVKSMVNSDYVLCCRGMANFSNRLYEALCCGRIPVFINTDRALPFDSVIDWKKYCVWVELEELPQIAEKVAEFHDRLSPQEFIDLQYACRDLWKNWLSSEGFFTQFSQSFAQSFNSVHQPDIQPVPMT